MHSNNTSNNNNNSRSAMAASSISIAPSTMSSKQVSRLPVRVPGSKLGPGPRPSSARVAQTTFKEGFVSKLREYHTSLRSSLRLSCFRVSLHASPLFMCPFSLFTFPHISFNSRDTSSLPSRDTTSLPSRDVSSFPLSPLLISSIISYIIVDPYPSIIPFTSVIHLLCLFTFLLLIPCTMLTSSQLVHQP